METNLSSLLWSIAELLRGDYRQSEYGKIILPFTLLRRLDCVLSTTKREVLNEYNKNHKLPMPVLDRMLLKTSGQSFYNISNFNLQSLIDDSDHLKSNLLNYIQGFSVAARDIFEKYDFIQQIEKLDNANLLLLILQRFASVDMSPEAISNVQMGQAFEELIRKFSELSNETAGEHFTPREVIRLMVDLLLHLDDEALAKDGTIRTLYDPTAGTGGMLSVAEEHLYSVNPKAKLNVYGQELNPESYAICKADMLIKGQAVENIVLGNTLSEDGHPTKKFDYMLSNPPFGVEWKKVEKVVKDEHTRFGMAGRFGAGLPRVSDGSLLFLMHLVSKMRPVSEGGSRIGIVLNGSPLFTGGAGSGESEIRRYMIENDLVETIVALPSDMFYNTGIATYVWILTNHKEAKRKGKIQLINANDLWSKMKKSLGSKRKEMNPEHIAEVVRLHGQFVEDERVKILDNADFGYTNVTMERPLLDDDGKVVKSKGKPKADAKKRDTENVPLKDSIDDYIRREVMPHVPDAWRDETKDKVGYEIPFNRFFYKYTPPRSLSEIDAELKLKVAKIQELLGEVSA